MSNQLKTTAKWLVLVLSYAYLAYKLITFNDYDSLFTHFQNLTAFKSGWLVLFVSLFPFNIISETLKWQKLVSDTYPVSFKQSIKAVFAGFTTGFFTPNRLGEPAGRILFLPEVHRKPGIILSYVSGFVQTYIIAIAGLPAALYFFGQHYSNTGSYDNFYLSVSILLIVASTAFYFFLPKIASLAFIKKRTVLFEGVATQSKKNLLAVMLFSLIRFTIFCVQFYAVLHFFGVGIPVNDAFIAIPASYFFVTFTPTMAFSEVTVRSSYAVFFIGAFSDQTAGIAFAGFVIWLLNSGLPMLIGSAILFKRGK